MQPSMIDLTTLRSTLPKRELTAHKGSCGRIGLVAGSELMAGAAILAARAAYRSGVGMVYVLTTAKITPLVIGACPEAIVIPVSDGPHLVDTSFEKIQNGIQTYKLNGLAIGPGLGRDPQTLGVVQKTVNLLKAQSLWGVIDADGISAFSDQTWTRSDTPSLIFTPHEGEFERLTKKSPKGTSQRTTFTQEFAKKSGEVVVLKGHQTVVSNGNETVINPTGNPSMATAGSGDVLTGILAGLLGQAVPLWAAARLGVYLHGLAGDLAEKQVGIGVMASDISDAIPQALMAIRS